MRKRLMSVKSIAVVLTAMVLQLSTTFGQVATLQNWTSIYHGTGPAIDGVPYSVPTGTDNNRVLVVAVATSRTTSGSITATLSYGGQPLQATAGDLTLSTRQHTSIYYLDEAGLDAATNTSLTGSFSGGTLSNIDVWAAVFDFVNQTSPFTNTQNYNGGNTKATSFSFPTPLTINAFDQAVEVVSSVNSGVKLFRTINYATDWAMILEQTTIFGSGLGPYYYIRNGVANRSIPTSNTTDASATTFDADAYASMTGVSISYAAPPPPTIQASDVTFSEVTFSSMTISWTPGNGTSRIVLIKAGSAVDGSPVDGTSYTAGNLFGSGSEIGTGNFVVYNGSDNSVTVTNLEAGTNYHVAVYEFILSGGLPDYLITDPGRGSQLIPGEAPESGDYRTVESGDWGTPGIWEFNNGTTWVGATSAPASGDGVINIRAGHTVTVAEDVTVDQVVVGTGGQVNISPGITMTIDDGTDAVDCNVNGTLYNEGTVTTTGTLSFNAGSTYQHALDGGTIPTATWDATSTCLVTGIINSALSGFGQSFGNFTWNCQSQSLSSIVAMNSDITVQGNFTLTSTGSGTLAITNGNTSVTMTVMGDYIQTGGTFDLNNGSSGTSIVYLDVAGDCSFTGGVMTVSSLTGSGAIRFNGSGEMQMFTSGGTINSSSTIDFTVVEGAYLQMGTGANPSVITGSRGTFTLSPGATLGITSPQGITEFTTSSLGGNIRVSGIRTFDPGANYIYNGSENQNTGNGLPPTVNSLVFNNTGGIVKFNTARTITNFSITSGSKANLENGFVHITSNLILGGIGQPEGSYGHPDSEAQFESDIFFAPSTGIISNAPAPFTWLGGVSTDWFNPLNWSGNLVPTSVDDATIPPYTANQPVISGETDAVSGTVTLHSGASLTITPAGSATFTTLANSGTLNLESDESGIASLILTTYTDNSGTENIELFLTGGGNETNYPWHYISSPVAELSVTDVISSGDDPDANDLTAYYETLVSDDKDLAWIGYDGWNYQSDDGLPAGNTFSNLETGSGYNYYSYYDATRIFGGNLNTGDVTKPLSYSGATNGLDVKGWNLLGNPFSSSIDWDQIAISLPEGEIDNAIYFTRNNSIVSYVDGVPSTGGVTGTIPPMQGFFVKANSSGQSITLPASARVHSTQNRYKGDGGAIPLIRLKIESNKISDETVIRLDEKAKITFDPNLDAYKFGKTGNHIGLWTTAGKLNYSINSIPFPETETSVPIGVNIPESGAFKLSASLLQGIENYDVWLTDKSTGITVNLRTTASLSFSASEGVLSDRFVIKFTNISTATENPILSESKFNIYSTQNMINVQTLTDEWDGKRGSVSLVDMTGMVISRTDNAEFWKGSMIQVPASGLNGIYFVKIQSGILRHVGKVLIK